MTIRDSATTLIFLGDFCVCDSSLPDLSPKFDALLRASQLICVNFGAPIVSIESQNSLKIGPTIGQSSRALDICRSWGITHLSFANNHIMDFGKDGFVNTLKQAQGFNTFGAGLCFEDAYKPHYCELNKKKIALLAFSEAQFGVLQDERLDGVGYAWIDHPKARQTMRDARANAEWVIVQVHAGLEMVGLPLPEWRERYRELIDLGADLVIGHHPHVLQGSECYKGKMIHYSLGNFYMDVMLKQADPGSGAALRVTIDNDRISSEILPLKVTCELIDIDTTCEARKRYQQLTGTLAKNEAYYKEIDKICDDFWQTVYSDYYRSALMGFGTKPSVNGAWQVFLRLAASLINGRFISQANELMLIHNIRIESHRWVVERALANRVKR